MAKKKSKKSRNWLLRLVLVVTLLLAGLELYRLQSQLQSARQQQQALVTAVMAQEQENEALGTDLEKADDPEYLQDLARKELGLVTPGERVFYDVGK